MEHELSGSEIIGSRVRFKSLSYPDSLIRFNDLGTVVGQTNFPYHSERQTRLGIRWNNGGNYTLIDGFDSLDIFADAGV